jgi:PadR family transcriptional regulator PadR
MGNPKSEVLQGTLDLLVLKTLDTMGPMHGFGMLCASSRFPKICCN